ncbi:uncharacterized protein PHACADRAFT_254555 [Phanerochaete carnosa HHB-10118-sp]|uniref:J domain-containing protein n=1 Tax=Phanerochaete carnosa (strain HHB-10118-sp) TaxID=650164 RepID=K5V388_PHACS|nr:uncharacterized protein PHACADRAFT_254555 [Phanerochaete carnosa HHB-10118-sp]EKM57036.1 hypothetical protein PHACADRAFT_254555 [Phanerochaete carnosa HHB-10118-sp]
MPDVPAEGVHDPNLAQPEYLYTVLNLPTTATKEEIRERYRQLSLIFHPDKQHGKPTQETALKRFLEVQKAYEILSDSVTRQAYDLYGLEGVRLARDLQLSGLPLDVVENKLKIKKAESDYLKTQTLLQSNGEIGMGVDARPLFVEADNEEFNNSLLLHRAWVRITSLRLTGVAVKNVIQKSISDTLILTMSGQSRVGPVGRLGSPTGRHLIGTARYQFSPKIGLEASASLLRSRNLALGANFDDGDNVVAVKAFFAPGFDSGLANLRAASGSTLAALPPVTFSLQRRLFPGAATFGIFEFATNSSLPSFTLAVSSQKRLDLGIEESTPLPRGPPSRTGLASCVGHWSFGTSVLGVLPVLFGECGLIFVELGLQLKARLEAGLQAQTGVLSVSWGGERNTTLSRLGFDVGMGTGGVELKISAIYMNQLFYVPIALSSEFNELAAFWATVVPTTAVTLGYWFVLRPLKQRERLTFFHQARRELREAKADIVRAAEETVSLLRDTARRHTEAEASKDGLVIVEARYGPADQNDESTKGLDVDVTVPLQALVNNSQLYIPGGRSKAGLQGFYDPVPSVGKSMRVRYIFRGHPHCAEISDFAPLVLPLEDHLVS